MIASQRIAHVSTVHHPLDPRIYHKQVATLRTNGIETWLIARNAPGRPDARFLALNDEKGITKRLRRHIESLRHLKTLRPKIVHIHDPELIPVARLARARFGCKVIYDMHEDYAGRNRAGGWLLRRLENWCFRWVDHVVLAESSYESILKGRSTPSTVILNYILPPNSEPSNTDDDRFTLIYSGTISNCRGLNNMLDLAAEIKKAQLPWRLRIVGVSHLPDERAEAEARIAREGLEAVVERVGWDRYVPWSDIATEYQGANLGLALFEPLRNHSRSILSKFYEYIYFGLPVIHSGFPLWCAFFEANGCGISVDQGEAARILDRLRRLAGSRELTRLVEHTGEQRSRYVWSRMEPRLIHLYRDLLDREVH